ncbi:MAG: hypothetical protein JNM63_11115 [Spirochaetia bacterium]|nr:hypothetical protein [Spirochaetia bacterium]
MSDIHNHHHNRGIWGGTYGLLALGIGIYLVQHASGFWPVVYAIIKAIFFPVLIGYKFAAWLGM